MSAFIDAPKGVAVFDPDNPQIAAEVALTKSGLTTSTLDVTSYESVRQEVACRRALLRSSNPAAAASANATEVNYHDDRGTNPEGASVLGYSSSSPGRPSTFHITPEDIAREIGEDHLHLRNPVAKFLAAGVNGANRPPPRRGHLELSEPDPEFR
jgi:hypothetical protein